MKDIFVCPSILSADVANLGHEVNLVKKAGADALHVDIMDGHFVNNISFGVSVVEGLHNCGLLLDVHLMVTNPLNFVESFARAGAGVLTFHVECFDDVQKCLFAAKSFGCEVGLAVKPSTNISAIEKFLPELNLVVIMTVEPGFSGQAFQPSMLKKVEEVRRLSSKVNISVDGGVNFKTAQLAKKAGANWLVAGTSIFKANDYATAIAQLKE